MFYPPQKVGKNVQNFGLIKQPTFFPGLHLLLDLRARVGGEQLEGMEEAEQRHVGQQRGPLLLQRGLLRRLQQHRRRRRRRRPDAAGQRPHKEGHG